MYINIKALVDEMDALHAELESLPEGCLVTHKRKNDKKYYGHQITVNGKHKEKYIKLKDYPRWRMLFNRRAAVKRRLREIYGLIKGRKRAVLKYRALQQEARAAMTRKLKAEAALHGAFLPEELVHYTSRGEFVRSKSELNIANYLHFHGVDYIYEMSVQVAKGKYLYPDFSVKVDGEWVYIEHLGKLEDPEYAARWEEKKALYAAAGIIEGVNLICTREYYGHLDMQEIDMQLRQHGIIR